MTTMPIAPNQYLKEPLYLWLLFCLMAAALYLPYREGIHYMYVRWVDMPEYSHALFLPAISAFLIYSKRDVLERMAFTGSWLGTILVALSFVLFTVGELSALLIISIYSLWLLLVGLVLALTGMRVMGIMLVPLLSVFLMIPLPDFLFFNLSSQLQLVSSALGVYVVRAFDIPVYLEGNVIDLGAMKLQVVEACSGLRYLFPLMSLGFVMASFFRASLWKKIILFFSTIPLTILMNSLRIGVIGVTVDYWGTEAAEGFLHAFEGWFVFMSCLLLLFAEMLVLNQIGGQRWPWREVFLVELPAPRDAEQKPILRGLPLPFKVACTMVLVASLALLALPTRDDVIPKREHFFAFPQWIDGWVGRPEVMDSKVEQTLKVSDYLLMNYEKNGQPLKLYVAYYESQRKGASAHSPKSCIPGGGWRIDAMEQREMDAVWQGTPELVVNRVLISKGDDRHLVYYWFQQRGRIITNEYLVKWYLFVDALFDSRTDGAMVRVTMPLSASESEDAADRRMQEFLRQAYPLLSRYIPE